MKQRMNGRNHRNEKVQKLFPRNKAVWLREKAQEQIKGTPNIGLTGKGGRPQNADGTNLGKSEQNIHII